MLKGRFLEIRVDVTVNKGNYESEKVGITYSPDEEENIFEVIEMCKNIAYQKGGKVEVKVDTAPSTKAAPASKKKDAVKETPKAEDKPTATSEDKNAVEEKAEETKAEEAPAKEEGKKRSSTKVINYNREDGQHKKKLADLLNKHYPQWKTDEKMKKNALNASAEFSKEPTPFIDSNGEVTPEFLAKLDSLLNA